MTTPIDASPFEALSDAVRQHLTVALNAETLTESRQSAERLWSELRRQESRAKADMGGTTLDLSLEEVRLLRSGLEELAWRADEEERDAIASTLRAIRKRLNQGVVRNCERRTKETT